MRVFRGQAPQKHIRNFSLPQLIVTTMIMKKFLMMILAVMAFSAPSFAQTANERYIAQAESWLQNLKTAQARFTQIDYQGRELNGTFYINRPGRLRFEYDQPITDHILADGTMIYFYDGESQQASNAPIGMTLADFILRPDVRMDQTVKVESVRDRKNVVEIALSQRDQPGTGQLILHFSKSPFALQSWRIIDAQGLTTDIILSNFKQVASLDPRLFVYHAGQSQDRFNQ